MSEWKDGTLGEFITLRRGHDLPERIRIPGEYPVFSSSGITGYHNEYKVSDSGVITGRYGTIGQVFFTATAHWPLNTTLYVEDFKGNNKKFIYYLLQTLEWSSFADVASAVPGINRNHVHLANVSIPETTNEQQSIAEVLSSLDDKIDLLTRQNATLEALAQTYFRQWFVEKETMIGRLDSIAQITMGQSPSGDSYNEDGRGTVFFQGRAEFGWRYPTIRLYTTEPQRMARKGDILMSVRAPVGDINIATEDCCIGRGLASIHSDYPTFVLYALKEQTEQLAIFDGEGTVFGSITKEGLNGLDIHLPNINRIKDFETSFSILDKKIDNNTNQIQTLQKLRDTLLPKLISGEMRVTL